MKTFAASQNVLNQPSGKNVRDMCKYVRMHIAKTTSHGSYYSNTFCIEYARLHHPPAPSFPDAKNCEIRHPNSQWIAKIRNRCRWSWITWMTIFPQCFVLYGYFSARCIWHVHLFYKWFFSASLRFVFFFIQFVFSVAIWCGIPKFRWNASI